MRSVVLALGEESGFGAALEAELGEEIGHVVLDGLLGEEHLVRDLSIAQPLAQQFEDPALLGAQALETDVLGDLAAQAFARPLAPR